MVGAVWWRSWAGWRRRIWPAGGVAEVFGFDCGAGLVAVVGDDVAVGEDPDGGGVSFDDPGGASVCAGGGGSDEFGKGPIAFFNQLLCPHYRMSIWGRAKGYLREAIDNLNTIRYFKVS